MTTRHKVQALAGVLFILVPIIGFFAYNGATLRKEITTEEAQQRINDGLEKRALSEQRVNVESVTVRFADDKIYVNAKASGIVRKRKLTAEVDAVGVPEYRSGGFYFLPTAPLNFKNVKVEKIEPSTGFFSKTKELLKKKAEAFVVEHGWEDALQTFKVEFQEWVVATAEKGVTNALTKHPIYTLKNDMKGFAISAVLEKVKMADDKLVLTLSLVQLGYTIFISLVCLVVVIGMVAFLIMNPEWGMLIVAIDVIGRS